MKTTLFTLALLCASCACAQDPFYSQYNSGWSMVNPAYAGSLACGRAEMGYRLQWPALSASYTTFNAEYDQLFKIGGAGFNYTHDAAGQGVIKTDRFDFNYSYPIGIGMADDYKPKLVIQPGVQVSYQRKVIDWSKLNFGDMIDPRRGFVYNTTETPAVTTKNNIDFSVGLLAYTKRICVGLSAYHLTQPDEGFLGPSKLPMRLVYTTSFILFNADPEENGLSIIPSVVYMKQETFENTVVSVTAKYDGITAGIGYRNLDAFLFMGGYTWNNFGLSYSYDYTVSKLGKTGGAHEVHLSYRFAKDKWAGEKRSMQAFM